MKHDVLSSSIPWYIRKTLTLIPTCIKNVSIGTNIIIKCGKPLMLFIQKRKRKTLTFLDFDSRIITKLRVEKLQSSSLVGRIWIDWVCFDFKRGTRVANIGLQEFPLKLFFSGVSLKTWLAKKHHHNEPITYGRRSLK